MPDPVRHVLISKNPRSGASDQSAKVDALAVALENRGLNATILTDIEELLQQVQQFGGSNESELVCVVAAGGDGTVSLLANSLPANTPLAIFPLGTENLLAKFLHCTADAESAAAMIVAGETVTLDAGRANGKLFLVMASCGFDADVVHRLHSARTGHIRHWSYAKPVVSSIGKYRYPTIKISLDGQSETVNSKWAFVFNVPRYAMNLPIVADADPTDGRLDLCTFRGGSLARGLFYLFAVLARRHRTWTNSRHLQFETLTMETDSVQPVPFQLDGDPAGFLPVTIETLPGFLTLIRPASRG